MKIMPILLQLPTLLLAAQIQMMLSLVLRLKRQLLMLPTMLLSLDLLQLTAKLQER